MRLGECYQDEYYLQFVALYPQYQGYGLGYYLMHLGEQEGQQAKCHKLALDVDSKNKRAIKLYQNSGFHVSSKSPLKPRPEVGQVFRMVKNL